MFEHFEEVSDRHEPKPGETPIWYLISFLLAGVIVIFLTGALIAIYNGIAPTLYNLLNNNPVTEPFAVTAINMLQLAHFIVASALYYRTLHRSLMLARVQFVLATATHSVLLIALFLLPFFGWSQDWASPIAVLVWGAWEGTALLALRAIYLHKLVIHSPLSLTILM